ncbi:MAG TPA: hypothetical protein VIG99_12640 [Myxococcaceae bacterium]|jgi:hypothetical protein
MTKEELFAAWAPGASWWSPWAKPVLFAHVGDWAGTGLGTAEAAAPAVPSLPQWIPPPGGTALVLDLPGALGIQWGVALARQGYRPVPLYNAAPAPPGEASVVDMRPLIAALMEGAPLLAASALPDRAPPAFLLDAARGGPGPEMLRMWRDEEVFDNRAVSFPTDFPSARLLRERGIDRALLIQLNRVPPLDDLADALRLWAGGGVAVNAVRVEAGDEPLPLALPAPSWLGWIVKRALALVGLRRNAVGGFGAWRGGSSA